VRPLQGHPCRGEAACAAFVNPLNILRVFFSVFPGVGKEMLVFLTVVAVKNEQTAADRLFIFEGERALC
jgi:hypothetical protein